MISAQKLKLVHVARRELELPEQSYREILRHHGGVESSKDLDDDGFKRGHELNEGARVWRAYEQDKPRDREIPSVK